MKSTTIIAFDQHAATTVAAVLVPGERTPALHELTSDIPTIVRFLERVRRVELQLGVEPSHYEPGDAAAGRPATTGAESGRATGSTEEREALKL